MASAGIKKCMISHFIFILIQPISVRRARKSVNKKSLALPIGLIFYTNTTRETGRSIYNKCILTIESLAFGLRIQDGCQKTRFVHFYGVYSGLYIYLIIICFGVASK